MSLYNAIKSANVAGRMGLIVYTIPGFPSPAVFKRVERLLEQSEGVSIVETTIPVTGGFSDHANEFIIEAHKIPSFSGTTSGKPTGTPKTSTLRPLPTDHGRLRLPRGSRPFAWPGRGPDRRMGSARGERPILLRLRSAGIELVQCVGPWMTGNEIENLMRMSRDDSLVYLMSAERTGGQLFSAEALAECARTIRRFRQRVKIAAGFGIATPKRVQRLKGIPDIDAVIIGTAFLRAMGRGFPDAARFLQDIEGSLQ